MRKLVVVEYVSLDGVIQAPGHDREDPEGFDHGGWTQPFMSDHRRYMLEPYRAAGAILLGRRTYEIFAAYWPGVTDARDEIARALNTLPKYVASRTLREPQWAGTTVLEGDVARSVRALKDERGKDILVVGSSGLAQTLIDHTLVDEYQLWLHPVVLGGGKRLFRQQNSMQTMRLVDSKTAASGLVLLTYAMA